VTSSQNHRILRWIERGVLLLLVLYLSLHTMPRAWRTLNTDFPNYYMSARLAHEGHGAPVEAGEKIDEKRDCRGEDHA
jgi:hypothetical protein